MGKQVQVCRADSTCQEMTPDMRKMCAEFLKIVEFIINIEQGKSTEVTYGDLKTAIPAMHKLMLYFDSENDVFKRYRFDPLIPLLCCSDSEVVAAVSKVIVDLYQKNKLRHYKSLDCNTMPQLVKLMDAHPDERVCLAALHALSCLCANIDEIIKVVEVTNCIPVLLRILQKPDEKPRTKVAIFLSKVTKNGTLQESLFQADIISILLRLLKERMDSSSEHLLCVLVAQVSHHKQSRIQCRKDEYDLKNFLQQKIQFYASQSKYATCKKHCLKILKICFHDEKN